MTLLAHGTSGDGGTGKCPLKQVDTSTPFTDHPVAGQRNGMRVGGTEGGRERSRLIQHGQNKSQYSQSRTDLESKPIRSTSDFRSATSLERSEEEMCQWGSSLCAGRWFPLCWKGCHRNVKRLCSHPLLPGSSALSASFWGLAAGSWEGSRE